MNYILYFIIAILFFFSSCEEETHLSASNEVYVSVTSVNDSVIVLFNNDSDTLLRNGNELYDTSGRLFVWTQKDTIVNLNNENAKRWIKKTKANEYISATFTGTCWVERHNVRIYTFDSQCNILKIKIPNYNINYVAEKYVLPVKKNTLNTRYYYPDNEKLNHYTIKYQKNGILIKSKFVSDEFFHYVNNDLYFADGKLFLSCEKDTTIMYEPPLPPLEGYPLKCEIRSVHGNCEEFSAIYYENPDTAFRFVKEYIYDRKYKIKVVVQPCMAEFVLNNS
jgi:hypothetical protein